MSKCFGHGFNIHGPGVIPILDHQKQSQTLDGDMINKYPAEFLCFEYYLRENPDHRVYQLVTCVILVVFMNLM